MIEPGVSGKLKDGVEALADLLLQETLAICRVPAPTFSEEARARYIEGRLRELGLQSVETDSLHNVTAVLPGSGDGPTLMVVSHIDTVFPAGTDVEPRWDGTVWRAPGIRDNSASAAVNLLVPEILRRVGLELKGDLILGFSVGEEGLGNLRGMRALMERFGPRISAVLAADGGLGIIGHAGVSVRRLKVVARAEGGHSWADVGKPSAVHVLGRIAAGISQIEVPEDPRSALNIGTFNGGTSVNAIAAHAEFLLDIRSVEQEVVVKIEERVRAIIAAGSCEGVDISLSVVGDRPGGRIAEDHPLIQAIQEGYRAVGVTGSPQAISTDANIPLWLGIPAASMGVSAGGGVHTLDEFLDPGSLTRGAQALVLTLLSLQRSLCRDNRTAPVSGL